MTTAELIPLILLELNECDKYGFELTKSIETKSNGLIIIKQPTLYTVLKKLEKSKFISSYWLDSDIGGKRHYYKITNNGRYQVSTLPSFDILIKQALANEETEANISSSDFSNEIVNEETPSILPSQEIFKDNSIDIATEVDINNTNIEILKSETEKHMQNFANDENVSKFTKSSPEISNETKQTIIDKSNEINNDINLNFDNYSFENVEEVNYFVDYVDQKNNPKAVQAVNTYKTLLFKNLFSCIYLLLILTISYICNLYLVATPIYYFFTIATYLYLIMVSALFIANTRNMILKFQEKTYKPNFKKQLMLATITLFIVIIVCLVANVSIKVSEIFSINNFLNIYVPILLSAVTYFDILLDYLIFKKK